MRNRVPALVLLVLGGVSLLLLSAIVNREHNLYPAWSSLSSDAKGTSVWYESLLLYPEKRPQRNYLPLSSYGSQRHVTMLILGVPLRAGPPETERMLKVAEDLAHRGERVVLSFDREGMTAVVGKEFRSFSFPPKHQVQPVWSSENLHWHPQGSWRALPTAQGNNEVIERSIGTGSLVLMADSEAVSNQSLAQQPDVPLLLALAPSEQVVVFDESHLGMEQTGTVLGLFRHYRLQGLLYGLLILCALVIWRSLMSFPARLDGVSSLSAATLSDALDGLANLLARSVPAKDLLLECVRLRLASQRNPALRSTMTKIAADPSGSKQDVVQRFRNIQSALSQRAKGGRNTSMTTEIHP